MERDDHDMVMRRLLQHRLDDHLLAKWEQARYGRETTMKAWVDDDSLARWDETGTIRS
jgi:hypothetical protein